MTKRRHTRKQRGPYGLRSNLTQHYTLWDRTTHQFFVSRRGAKFKHLGTVATLEEAAALVRADRDQLKRKNN